MGHGAAVSRVARVSRVAAHVAVSAPPRRHTTRARGTRQPDSLQSAGHSARLLRDTPSQRKGAMRVSAAVLYDVRKPVVIEDVELLEPGPHEVQVRWAANGVCH